MAGSEHSREPWTSGTGDTGCEEVYSEKDGRHICETDEVHARRIVAAINACAGLSTEHLERMAAAGGFIVELRALTARMAHFPPTVGGKPRTDLF